MREILFRGKREDKNWTYGYYVFQKKRNGCFGQTITANDFDRHYIVTPRSESFCVLPETVEQYTGLTDNNGTKIFEGDILERKHKELLNHSQKMIVKFIPVNACFSAVDIDGGNVTFINDYINNKYSLEVIGNIHDNPELLNLSEIPNS